MTITYPLSLPAIPGFSQFDMRMMPIVGVSKSQYTGNPQIYEYQGQWWEADIALANYSRDNAALWQAFLGLLNGRKGSFLLGDPAGAAPRGAASSSPGTPVADGAQSALAQTLNIKGAPDSIAGWLKAGDYFQLGSGATTRLHMNLIDADTDGSGKTTLTIWPRLRGEGIADNAAIVVSNCKGRFRLTANANTMQRQRGPLFAWSGTVEEDL